MVGALGAPTFQIMVFTSPNAYRETVKKRAAVATNGCFDLFHSGHVELLRAAAKHGELVVGVDSDRSVATLKGPTRPVIPLFDRVAVVAACRYVHHVVMFDSCVEFLDAVRPYIWVKGADRVLNAEEVRIVTRHKGCVEQVVRVETSISTSKIIHKIRNDFREL